jgi:GAF domain-containing protein
MSDVPLQKIESSTRPFLGGSGSEGEDGPDGNQGNILAREASIASHEDLMDALLQLVVGLADDLVGRADGASVTLRRHGELGTVAASNRTISAMDDAQYATGEGPCLDASLSGTAVHLCSMEAEVRWPKFSRRATALGVNAVISTPLFESGRPIGALNIYSQLEGAFESADLALASLFASQASAMLSRFGNYASDAELASAFRHALVTRRAIAQAEGVIMEREGIGGNDAYSVIRRVSIAGGRTLREQADDIVKSAGLTMRTVEDERGTDG